MLHVTKVILFSDTSEVLSVGREYGSHQGRNLGHRRGCNLKVRPTSVGDIEHIIARCFPDRVGLITVYPAQLSSLNCPCQMHKRQITRTPAAMLNLIAMCFPLVKIPQSLLSLSLPVTPGLNSQVSMLKDAQKCRENGKGGDGLHDNFE